MKYKRKKLLNPSFFWISTKHSYCQVIFSTISFFKYLSFMFVCLRKLIWVLVWSIICLIRCFMTIVKPVIKMILLRRYKTKSSSQILHYLLLLLILDWARSFKQNILLGKIFRISFLKESLNLQFMSECHHFKLEKVLSPVL